MGFIDDQQPAPAVDVVVVQDRLQPRPRGPEAVSSSGMPSE